MTAGTELVAKRVSASKRGVPKHARRLLAA